MRDGYRVAFEDRALAYEETTKNSTQEFQDACPGRDQRHAGTAQRSGALAAMRHAWTTFQLLSHKILRWMVPLFLLPLFAGSAANLHIAAFRLLVLLQVLFYGFGLAQLAVSAACRWKILGIPLFFCTLTRRRW